MKIQPIRVLIIGQRVNDFTPVVHFLQKRNFEITIKGNLRDAVSAIVQKRPDWVFLSMNLDSSPEKFVGIVKHSFKLETVLFGEVLDRRTLAQLDAYRGHAMTSKMTGPSLQLKIQQIINDVDNGPSGPRQRSSSGVKKSSYGHIHLRAEDKPVNGNTMVMGSSAPSPGRNVIQLDPAARIDRAPDRLSPEDELALKSVEQINVMISEQEGVAGYLVLGGTEAEADALRAGLKDKVIGPFKANDRAIPNWEALRGNLSKKNISGLGDLFSCFVPKEKPLPAYRACKADETRAELRLADIPTETPLPCAFFVYLAQNQKFVCLIKAGGQLASSQQERLLKLGLQALIIFKDDLQAYNHFYVKEKLALPADELERSA